MDENVALNTLASCEERKPSELGEAVDVLYQIYRSYTTISKQVKIPRARLSSWHRVFRLPIGIQWQVNQENISVGQAHQIANLKEEDDKWLLAFVVVETKQKLSNDECRNVVQEIIKNDMSIWDAISKVGVRFDKEIILMLPFSFDERFLITKSAWNKHEKIENFCLQKIREGTKIDTKKIAAQIEKLAVTLRGEDER